MSEERGQSSGEERMRFGSTIYHGYCRHRARGRGVRGFRTTYRSLSERCLASHLREKGVSFKSQIEIAGYCIDFLVSPNLIVEAEGKVHSARQEYDAARTELLESLGFRVFRIPNYMIFSDPSGVAEMIRLQTATQRVARVDSQESRSSNGSDP